MSILLCFEYLVRNESAVIFRLLNDEIDFFLGNNILDRHNPYTVTGV